MNEISFELHILSILVFATFLQGSSVIRMLRSFIGDKKFQKGLEVFEFLTP